MNEDFAVLKVCVIGNYGVGKTSLVESFCQGAFCDQRVSLYKRDFISYHPKGGEKLKVQVWDTAGQERFRDFIVGAFFRRAKVVLLCFSISDPQTLQKIPFWKDQCQTQCHEEKTFLLVGCCGDGERKVSNEEIESIRVTVEAIKYVETSSKLMKGVNELFEMIAVGPKRDDIEYVCRKAIWMCLMLQKRSNCCWNAIPKDVVMIILKKYIWERRFRDNELWMNVKRQVVEEKNEESFCLLN